MAKVYPFRALRYNLDRVPNLSSVIAPPYDVISEEKRNALLKRDPNNCIRLILGDPSTLQESERQNPDRYRKAAALMAEWKENRLLMQDSQPAIYVLEESFLWKKQYLQRIGFFITLEMEEFGGGNVLPHERTMATPIEDRLALMKETKTHTSALYMTFDDSDKEVRHWLEGVMTSPPLTTFKNSDEGISYRLWIYQNESDIHRLIDLLAPKPFLIADGHHRYTTALQYMKGAGKEVEEARRVMIYGVPSPDPGIILSAIHRVFETKTNYSDLLTRLKEIGTLTQMPLSPFEFEDSGALLALLHPPTSTMQLFTPKPQALKGMKKELHSVPSTILNDLIVYPLLGIDVKKPDDQKKIQFVKYLEGVAPNIHDGKSIGFWLKPLSVSEVIKLSKAGFVLPQKSTFFYPKVQSGIVFHPLT